MMINPSIIRSAKKVRLLLSGSLVFLFLVAAPSLLNGQAVTEIITDYNGYWKSGATALNPVLPDNHHNLLSFSYNGTRYSTGVNDALLTSNGQTFTSGVYQALPLQNVNGTPSSNTKIGLGAMVDGVYNGAGAAPSRSLGPWLNDGPNGLDMGTCVANLPAGTMFMSVSNIQAAKIGDGIPDILVTQIADPSTTYDSYEFTDVNGVRIGNPLDVVLNNIQPVGSWTADFYEATGGTILAPVFTQTSRNIRLWAADFSTFGLNASNIGDVAYFKITLSGQSDIAFVAYNTTTISVQQVLAMNGNTNRISRSRSEAEVKTLAVYPNPASAIVNFSHPKAGANATIGIYSMSGILVKQLKVSAGSTVTSINVSSWGRGTYQAAYLDEDKRLSQKFIVQ